MARNEDGEFELVLGNRQLLSVFFIVVILLGVFFMMGYIVGRNSAPVAMAEADTRKVADPGPRPVERAPAEPKPAEPSKAVESPKEEKPSPAPRTQAPARAAPAALSGTYLQLAATTRHDAEIMVDVLSTKNFKATLAEVPEKPDTFRVLVGPLAEGTLNQTRVDLQNAGFPGNLAIKRTF